MDGLDWHVNGTTNPFLLDRVVWYLRYKQVGFGDCGTVSKRYSQRKSCCKAKRGKFPDLAGVEETGKKREAGWVIQAIRRASNLS